MAKNTQNNIKLKKDDITYRIYLDLVNGLTKYEVYKKLKEDAYPEPTSQYSNTHRYRLVKSAFDMAKEECEEKIEEQRHMMYNRILAVYNDSINSNDRVNALKALDQLSKLIGLYDNKQKVELSGNLTENVNISFGFTEEKE